MANIISPNRPPLDSPGAMQGADSTPVRKPMIDRFSLGGAHLLPPPLSPETTRPGFDCCTAPSPEHLKATKRPSDSPMEYTPTNTQPLLSLLGPNNSFSRNRRKPPPLFELATDSRVANDSIASLADASRSTPGGLLEFTDDGATPQVCFCDDGTLRVGEYVVGRDGCHSNYNVLLMNDSVVGTKKTPVMQLPPPLSAGPSPQLRSTGMEEPVSPIVYVDDEMTRLGMDRESSWSMTQSFSESTCDVSPMIAVTKATTTTTPVRANQLRLMDGARIPLRLEDLVICGRIGGGESSTVFRAIHRFTKRHFAVKELDLSPLIPQSAHASFDRMPLGRAQHLANIVQRELQVLHLHYKSPHLLKTYDAFYLSDCHTLNIVSEIMEYGSLEALGVLLAKGAVTSPGSAGTSNTSASSGDFPVGGKQRRVSVAQTEPARHSDGPPRAPLPERILAVVAEQALLGLKDMHARHHIHRDIKPTNMLINKHGFVKLSDFGLAEVVRGHVSPRNATPNAEMLAERDLGCSGTNKFMSPERHRGEPHGEKSDIWALGMAIAECALGSYPINLSHCHGPFDFIKRLQVAIDWPSHLGLSENFKDFVAQCSHPQPDERPTADELLQHPLFNQWKGQFDFKGYLLEHIQKRIAASAQKSAQERAYYESLSHKKFGSGGKGAAIPLREELEVSGDAQQPSSEEMSAQPRPEAIITSPLIEVLNESLLQEESNKRRTQHHQERKSRKRTKDKHHHSRTGRGDRRMTI